MPTNDSLLKLLIMNPITNKQIFVDFENPKIDSDGCTDTLYTMLCYSYEEYMYNKINSY